MSIFVTLGFIAILIGIVLVVCGYTVAAQALRPGWGALILGVILVLIGYLVPYIVTAGHPDNDTCIGADC